MFVFVDLLDPHLNDLASAKQRIVSKEGIGCSEVSRHPLLVPIAVQTPTKEAVVWHGKLLMLISYKDPLA